MTRTILARTPQGDALYRTAAGCFVEQPGGTPRIVAREQVIEALIAINAGQGMYDHWELAGDVDRLCAIVEGR